MFSLSLTCRRLSFILPWISFGLSCLVFTQFLASAHLFFFLAVLAFLSLNTLSFLSSLCSSLSETLLIQMLVLLLESDRFLRVCSVVFSLFSLFLGLKFYCSFFKFSDSVLCHFHCAIEPIQRIFISVNVFFGSMISI